MAIYLSIEEFKNRNKKAAAPTGAAASVEDKYTVKELKEMCKEKGITGYSKMKEAELIEVLGL